MTSHARWSARVPALAGAAALALTAGLLAPAAATAADAVPPASAPLTNLAHLDFLLDEATPPRDVAGHSTYRLAEEPTLTLPWTYADARDGGTFERIGGGQLDAETGHWTQGAYNADDITRAAVVYLRHWELTGSETSRHEAYELLRATAYLQTTDGPDAGNVVLWMQPDGTLNPSAEPVELPDPSDSGASYWLARTIWALGEGYAAFADDDPAFAAFLDERLGLALDALDRQVLSRYGEWTDSDGVRVPAWLIVNGADASAEAALGLAARVEAGTHGRAADALRKLAEGIGALAAGGDRAWPYGALMPWAESTTMWHGWASQMPAALAAASTALGDPALMEPARVDAAVFTPTLLTAGGPDNGWFPSPTDRVQIAYGADSRLQSLLAVADATGSEGVTALAGMQAAWFFGANHADAVMYDAASGVTFDGLQADGSVNRNSGAESTIHGLLAMIALDAHPEVAALARTATTISDRDGLRVVEAEDAVSTDGTVSTPESWTGESSWSGDALTLTAGQRAVFDIGTADVRRWVEPVVWAAPGERSVSIWRGGKLPIGVLNDVGPAQGISPAAGVLRPRSLATPVLGDASEVKVDVAHGSLQLDALLVRPVVSRLQLADVVSLVHSAAAVPQPATIGLGDADVTVRVYDRRGELVSVLAASGASTVVLPPGGFAIAQR